MESLDKLKRYMESVAFNPGKDPGERMLYLYLDLLELESKFSSGLASIVEKLQILHEEMGDE